MLRLVSFANFYRLVFQSLFLRPLLPPHEGEDFRMGRIYRETQQKMNERQLQTMVETMTLTRPGRMKL